MATRYFLIPINEVPNARIVPKQAILGNLNKRAIMVIEVDVPGTGWEEITETQFNNYFPSSTVTPTKATIEEKIDLLGKAIANLELRIP